jgi:hypothetical protein
MPHGHTFIHSPWTGSAAWLTQELSTNLIEADHKATLPAGTVRVRAPTIRRCNSLIRERLLPPAARSGRRFSFSRPCICKVHGFAVVSVARGTHWPRWHRQFRFKCNRPPSVSTQNCSVLGWVDSLESRSLPDATAYDYDEASAAVATQTPVHLPVAWSDRNLLCSAVQSKAFCRIAEHLLFR